MEKSEEKNDLPLKSSSMSENKAPTTTTTHLIIADSASNVSSDINHEIIETVDIEFQKLILQEENQIEIENLEEEDDEIQVENEKVDGWSLDEVNQSSIEGEWTAVENGENQEVKRGGGKVKKSQYPNRPGEPDCTFYLKTGSCGFGSNCKFNHPPKKKQHKVRSLSNESQDSAAQVAEEKVENPKRVGHLECKYYLTPGGCKFGKVCRYHHPREKNASSAPAPAPPVSEFNFLGLPIRPGQRECPFYMRTGSCKFATNCRFNHPDPTAGGSEPVYDRSNSAPSSDPQSAISSWPSTDTIPYPNSTQTYMPNMLQPQGMHSSMMEWNGYQAPMSPLYPPQGNMRPSMGPSPTGPVDEYPERPGQKECQFYLKTGDCKYKSSCRFHHPKPQVQAQAQVQAHFQAPAPMSPSLSPMGLPLRPDQIICTHFSRFGICKYGASCKYDHTPNPNSGSHSVAAGSGPLPYYHNPVPFVRGPMGSGGDGNTGYVQQPV